LAAATVSVGGLGAEWVCDWDDHPEGKRNERDYSNETATPTRYLLWFTRHMLMIQAGSSIQGGFKVNITLRKCREADSHRP